MKYSQSEKMEIIGIVEGSSLSIRRTLERIAVSRSSFYQCYRRYQEDGYDGLAAAKRHQHYYWNRIPKEQRECVLKTARKYPEKSCREIAWYITDRQSFYVSESSVYRLLKAHDLITTPVYTMISACEKFSQPTRRMNQLWQTDFTYLKVVQWGWYYLSTVMDDFSRYIISWKLCTTMKASDVKEKITVQYRPRLLTDNGSCYIAGELREYLKKWGMVHTREKPFHPMIQGNRTVSSINEESDSRETKAVIGKTAGCQASLQSAGGRLHMIYNGSRNRALDSLIFCLNKS